MKKFISWNVNGLRACVTKGFLDFFNDTATTEIYTRTYTFPYTTLFRSTKLHINLEAVLNLLRNNIIIASRKVLSVPSANYPPVLF